MPCLLRLRETKSPVRGVILVAPEANHFAKALGMADGVVQGVCIILE